MSKHVTAVPPRVRKHALLASVGHIKRRPPSQKQNNSISQLPVWNFTACFRLTTHYLAPWQALSLPQTELYCCLMMYTWWGKERPLQGDACRPFLRSVCTPLGPSWDLDCIQHWMDLKMVNHHLQSRQPRQPGRARGQSGLPRLLLTRSLISLFQKVLMKLRKPRITATIWSSGKIICTGATRWVAPAPPAGEPCSQTRLSQPAFSLPLIIFFYFNYSEEEAKFGARRLARSLQKLGFQVTFSKNMHSAQAQGFNFIN